MVINHLLTPSTPPDFVENMIINVGSQKIGGLGR